MRIRLLVDVQGYAARADGTIFEWPRRGGEIEVEDAIGVDMVRAQQAVPVTRFQRSEQETAQASDMDVEERKEVASAADVFTRPQVGPGRAEDTPEAPTPPPDTEPPQAEVQEEPEASRVERSSRGQSGRRRR